MIRYNATADHNLSQEESLNEYETYLAIPQLAPGQVPHNVATAKVNKYSKRPLNGESTQNDNYQY